MATIMECTCNHDSQDKMYGKGRRVHNVAPGSDQKKTNRFRCTVCSSIKENSSYSEEKKGKS